MHFEKYTEDTYCKRLIYCVPFLKFPLLFNGHLFCKGKVVNQSQKHSLTCVDPRTPLRKTHIGMGRNTSLMLYFCFISFVFVRTSKLLKFDFPFLVSFHFFFSSFQSGNVIKSKRFENANLFLLPHCFTKKQARMNKSKFAYSETTFIRLSNSCIKKARNHKNMIFFLIIYLSIQI